MDTIRKTASQSAFGEYINKIYKKTGYLDKYGGSVVITGLTLFAFFLLFSYHYVLNHLRPLKANWLNDRCNPAVMPFAGIINPDPGMSKMEFTAQNFAKCTGDVLSKIVHLFLAPIYYVQTAVVDMFGELGVAVNTIRKLFAYLRTQLDAIIKNIINRIYNVLIAVQHIMISLRTIMNRTQGAMVTALYTVLTAYLSLRAYLGAFMEIIIIFLIILAAAAIIMWIFIFTWEIAIPMTVLFILIAIPFALVLIFINAIFKLTSSSSIPANPCFRPNTPVKLASGKTVPMSDVLLGDRLENGSVVRGTLNLLGHKGNKYFRIPSETLGEDIYVTGDHRLRCPHSGRFIFVKDSPDAIPTEEYDLHLSCLVTDDHLIQIGEHTFWDWED